MRGVAVFACVIRVGQQGACGITRKLVCKWRAPGAKAATLAIHLVIGLVFEIPKAQRTGIQFIFIRLCATANHRPIKLRVLANGDIKTAFSVSIERQRRYASF